MRKAGVEEVQESLSGLKEALPLDLYPVENNEASHVNMPDIHCHPTVRCQLNIICRKLRSFPQRNSETSEIMVSCACLQVCVPEREKAFTEKRAQPREAD